MTKTMSAIALALLLGAAPMAYAQTAQHPNTMNSNPQTTNANRAEETIQADQIRASKMIGSSVYDVQNRNIGKVRDLVLGKGGKTVGVKLSDLKTDNNRLTLDRTKEQLQQMANYRLKDRNTGAGSTTSPVHGGKLGSGH